MNAKIINFVNGWWPVFIIAVLTGGIVFQQWRITHPVRPELLRVGDTVSIIQAKDARGNSREIRFGGSNKTLLYVFSPDCIWCQRNSRAFAEVSKQASAYRVIALSLKQDGLDSFVAMSGMSAHGAQIYTVTDQSRQRLKLTGTPETVVVSGDGVVEAVWLGAYTGDIGKALEQKLHVILPVGDSSGSPAAAVASE